MAIQILKCPNCCGELQLDDNLELGVCMYCGGTIRIQDEVAKIKIVHSGKVEIDDSKKLTNSLALADRAFEVGNYEECYNYCCAVLECDVNNAHSTFRKGLCAAYMSISRANELEQALKTSTEIIKNTSDSADNEIYVVFCELMEYIKSTYTLNCNRVKGFTYPSLAAANNTFSCIAVLTGLCIQCSELITDEMIGKHPTYEDDKKNCLELGIELCDQGMTAIKYFAGHRQVKKGDGYVQQEVYETAKSAHIDFQKKCMLKFKEAYNDLPTTRSAMAKFNGEIDSLQRDIDVFNVKLEEYFQKNPEIGKTYKKSAVPYVVLTVLMFIVTAVMGAVLVDSVHAIVFGIIMVLLSMGFVAIAVLSIVYLVRCSNNRKKIMAELPTELIYLKGVHDQSKIKMKSVKQEKDAFERKNILR